MKNLNGIYCQYYKTIEELVQNTENVCTEDGFKIREFLEELIKILTTVMVSSGWGYFIDLY